jgi:cephalosporin hydroxylase
MAHSARKVSTRPSLGDLWRRFAASPASSENSTFIDRPIDTLGLDSLYAERNAGGWRAFAGVPIERKWSDIFTIDVFLDDVRPSTIIELGTGSGGFSCYLATYAYLHGKRFHTFDTHMKGAASKRAHYRSLRLVRTLGGAVHRCDVFNTQNVAFIDRLIKQSGPTFIYCDNGDKIREVSTYAPCLKPGDSLGVHDFGSEIHDGDLAPFLDSGNYRHSHEAFFKALSSSNRVIQRLR